MKTPALLVVGLLIFALPTSAFEEPDNVRGIKWGSSPEQATMMVTEQLRAKGNDWGKVTDLGDGKLIFSDTFGSIYTGPGYDGIPVTFVINFLDKKFISMDLGFKPEDFSRIEQIFITRYGRPTHAKNSEVQNAIRARFMNRQVEWIGKTVKIRLVKYAGSVTSGSGFISQQAWLDHLGRQSRKNVTEGAKGL